MYFMEVDLNDLFIYNNNIIIGINIFDKSETIDGGVYHIYSRNLYELKSVELSELRISNENVELKNTIYEENINIPFDLEGSNSVDKVKCDNVTIEEKYNLEECPTNEDFYRIWNHVLCITKERFDDMLKELALYIEDYLYKYEYECYYHFRNMKYAYNFYSLVKDGASIDEMKNYMYSFIKYYDTLKLDSYNEHSNIFTERMKNPQRLDI
ncbi:Plasmodium exported protein (PHISTa), unknown, putative [Plasmodium sp.]|nr:Plasmodium exported protein (PHISTa), unknown, putative [Plasmodium sp.]